MQRMRVIGLGGYPFATPAIHRGPFVTYRSRLSPPSRNRGRREGMVGGRGQPQGRVRPRECRVGGRSSQNS